MPQSGYAVCTAPRHVRTVTHAMGSARELPLTPDKVLTGLVG
ncbi:hypothetical protein RKE30_19230 [Streptomyces sp. Li-HN-5-11]|nr:hypothetical protein [Streptomyces sp. Li-HN-5-11]WNM32392.1 hypothetical protein RKE30_19230 [Streptomyces sp. Li-HN-5-11]